MTKKSNKAKKEETTQRTVVQNAERHWQQVQDKGTPESSAVAPFFVTPSAPATASYHGIVINKTRSL